VNTADQAIRKYIGYLPLLAVHIDQIPTELGEPHQSLRVDLLKEDLSGTTIIEFRGVQDLHIANVHPGSRCSIEIISITSDQLEDLRYRVNNIELDLKLNFYCRSFEISEGPLPYE